MDLEDRLEALAQPLRSDVDLDPLMDRIGSARLVLLGEASHGTSEFYTWRARITRRLVMEAGFSAIAVEGDWPDCARISQYLQHDAPGEPATDVLRRFERWPTWMWANREIAALMDDLRATGRRDVGFYGLDVYSLWDSLERVVRYLRQADPEAVPQALKAVDCLVSVGDLDTYAIRSRWLDQSCEDEVVSLLAELEPSRGGLDDDRFDAEQNALVVRNAERYYRTMLSGGAASWNLRDGHMADTLDRVMAHHGPGSRAVVWAHNTHIGDARFTDMARVGMTNLGQIVRERHGEEDVVLVGFDTYQGSVIAAPAWGEPMVRMPVPAARRWSWEELLHQVIGEDTLLLVGGEDHPDLRPPMGHRAIGVVYDPRNERGNYVPTVIPRRYDAILHLEHTRSLHPLIDAPLAEPEPPETYPSGM